MKLCRALQFILQAVKPCPSAVFYSCTQAICYPRPKRKKRAVGFCPFLRCHVLKEQRSNAATRPHQRGTGWRTEDRPLVLGKPSTELGNGTQLQDLGCSISRNEEYFWHITQGTSSRPRARREAQSERALLCSTLETKQFTKKGTGSTSVRRASSVSIPLQSLVTRRRRRRKMAADTLLCSGPASSEPEGLSQPRRVGRSKRGLVNGLTEEQRDTGGESSPLFPLPTPAAQALSCSQGMNPALLGVCVSPSPAGLPCPRVLLWVTALSKTQFWLHG